MICVREGIVNNLPSLLEREHLFINENSEQLNGRNSWMCVIKLDFILISKFGEPIIMFQLISSNDIINGSRTEEILLFQPELLTSICSVVGIENTSDILGLLSLTNSSLVVTRVKLIKIKSISWSRSPKTEVVGVIGIETWDWSIVSHSNYFLTSFPLRSFS